MQEAQETDLETMEALNDLFENFVSVEYAALADETDLPGKIDQ